MSASALRASIDERLAAAGLPPLPRAAWLEIDVDALASNLRAVREMIPSGTRVAAVIKADGYGHGLEVTGRALRAAGADLLCVATIDEAFGLRAAGIDAPVLVLYPVPMEAAGDSAAATIEVVVTGAEDGDALVRHSRRCSAWPAPLRVHLEVETGLERGGIRPEGIAKHAAAIAESPGLRLAGLWTHLASAPDAAFTAGQSRRLAEAAACIAAAGLPVPPLHIGATGALLTHLRPLGDMVRPGLCLYGATPLGLEVSPDVRAAADGLRPVMSLRARALRIEPVETGTPIGYGGLWTAPRPSLVATVPVGYADGYVRAYQPGGEALVRGRRVPVVGSIAMDAIHVDVTEVAGEPGFTSAEEFVLLGEQGDDRITAGDLARRRNTIPWEVLSSMARRLPRVYHAAAGPIGLRTLAGEFLVREDQR